MSRQVLLGVCLGLVGFLWPASPVAGQIYYQSATLGPIGEPSGTSVSTNQYLGSRFVVSSAVTITALGGHLFRHTDITGPLFAAVVSFPGTLPATGGSNALAGTGTVIHASATFTPTISSNDFLIPLSAAVTLNPNGNTYALIFGSGLFSTNGAGAMPNNNPNTPEGVGSYFWSNNASQSNYTWINGGYTQARFVVYTTTAVPEPVTVGLIGLGAAGVGLVVPLRRAVRRWVRRR